MNIVCIASTAKQDATTIYIYTFAYHHNNDDDDIHDGNNTTDKNKSPINNNNHKGNEI